MSESRRHKITSTMQLLWYASLLPALVMAETSKRAAPNCGGDVKPVAIPLKNITISTDFNIQSLHRCLPISYGGSDQSRLCTGIGTNLNNTVVSGNKPDSNVFVCDPARDKFIKDQAGTPDYRSCLAFRGGLYDLKNGFVESQNNRPWTNGSVDNSGFDVVNQPEYRAKNIDPFGNLTNGWDQINFGGKSMKGYPLIVIDTYKFNFGTAAIGLATESTFLNLGVETKQIPARAWGLEYGRMEDTIGEFVVGGYNGDKFNIAEATEFPVFKNKDIPCPLQVRVKSMTWGKNKELLDSGPFDACVEPTYHTTVMPLAVQKKWNEAWVDKLNWEFVASSWEHYDYNVTDDSRIPTEDIVITLDNGFTVNMPATNFWNPYREAVKATGAWKYTDGKITTRVGHAGFGEDKENNKPERDPVVGYLGGPFLSQLYLAVNYEDSKWYLQHFKNPQGRPIGQSYQEPQNLQILGCENVGSGKKGLAKWKIAVIVVFGLLALIGILVLVLWLLKRAHKKRDADAAAALAANSRPEEQSVGGPGAAGAYGYADKSGVAPVTRSETAYSEVPGSPYNGGTWSAVSPPTSPPPGSIAPAYSEIYGTERASTVPSQAGHGNWSSWGSPSPNSPQAPTATGFAPVEMAGDERIAEMGTTPVGGHGGFSEKR
ncbi:hypothetical protein BJ508DRAFT_412716 [Ascobolus immersus RN42]|uniref:Peptidase A1 domain-containing protein n=1 Tax=Ascobolus immersus RN42 TaxID=1160509 RepID=A0A3N4IFC2_ASCIM|nr:hypothetical protein BJ508DRAFT_412716 [Ascobolus immersus RN42]